ncbi:MAG: hypothetical protein ACRDJC_22280 [Thermomicrobiales bacterium]
MTTRDWGNGKAIVRAAVFVSVAFGLAACGDMPETGIEVTPPVPLSPVAGEIPEELTRVTAAITDAGLEPDQFAGQIDTAFQLVIQGDGVEHTLAIAELVSDTTIAPEGETAIEFTIVGEPGLSDIMLDGEPVGTFERQSAGGITDR